MATRSASAPLYLDETLRGNKEVSVLFADLVGVHAVHRAARLGRGARHARRLLRTTRADDPRRVRRRGGTSSSATRSSPSSTRRATSPTTRCGPPAPGSRSSGPQRRSRRAIPSGRSSACGVNTGEVLAGVVGDRGHRIHGVFGDTVNLGARLEGQCAGGGVLIGAATFAQLPPGRGRRARRRLRRSRARRSRSSPTSCASFPDSAARPRRRRDAVRIRRPACSRPSESDSLHSSTMRPSAILKMVIPELVAKLPEGGMPWKSPVWVPLAVQRATTLSPSPTMSSTVRSRSGNAVIITSLYIRWPVGVDRRHPREVPRPIRAVELLMRRQDRLERDECRPDELLVLLN